MNKHTQIFLILIVTICSYSSAKNYIVRSLTDTHPKGKKSELRWAIHQSNQNPGSTISFNIPQELARGGAYKIKLEKKLPTITATTVIDGTSQPGATRSKSNLKIILSGTPSIDGLVFQGTKASGSKIGGLVLQNFKNAIVLEEVNEVEISGNKIGTNRAGTKALPNDIGIFVQKSSRPIIGGTDAASKNLISGNHIGIYLRETIGAAIKGNAIGTTYDGSKKLGNDIGIYLKECSSFTIGRKNRTHDNLIWGNKINTKVIP